MANQLYKNFVLANEIENQLISHINHQGYCKIDNSLVGTAGMTKKINRYNATSGVEKLAMGEGNTKSIGTTLKTFDYTIELAQTRFPHYDEEQMTDPIAIATGARMLSSDLYNQINADIFAEFGKATKSVTGAFGFDVFADAIASMEFVENDEDPSILTPRAFAFVNKMDVAKIRKALKDELKFVESFVRTGYVGTVAGVNIIADKLATEGTAYVATREAVTLFNKTGVEVESERIPNTRQTIDYARKYYIAALTDATKVVKITTA